MSKGMFVDTSICIGCKACQVACKDKHDLEVGRLWRRVATVEGGDWIEQGAACALPESSFAGEHEDGSGTAPREPSPCDAAQVRLAAPVGVQGLDDLITAGDDERKPVVVVASPSAGRVGQVDKVQVTRGIGQGSTYLQS